MRSPRDGERSKKTGTREKLIIFTVPPPATLRDQDAADLEMLLAGLKSREGDNFMDPDEFGPLSGDRWHTVLERFLKKPERKDGAAELYYLARLVDKNGTTRPGCSHCLI